MKNVAGWSIDASSNRTSAIQVRNKVRFLNWALLGFLFWVQPSSSPMLAAGVVATCDQLSLEAALAGGGQVTFACSGVILLTNTISIVTDTILDGTGQSVTISGNDLNTSMGRAPARTEMVGPFTAQTRFRS